jgi:hypothetical protein
MLQAGRLLARLRRIATHSFGSEYPRTSASGSPSPAATATSADADGEVSITKILFLGGVYSQSVLLLSVLLRPARKGRRLPAGSNKAHHQSKNPSPRSF